jgi:hypothetical protein
MPSGHTTTVRHLRELIAALDWRLPQVQRIGEAKIAEDAALLKTAALRRIVELEIEMAARGIE